MCCVLCCECVDRSKVPVVGSIAPERWYECIEGVLEWVCCIDGIVMCVVAKMKCVR